MRGEVLDAVDVSSDDGAVPDGDLISNEDVSDDGGVGGDEDVAFTVDFEVVEVHNGAGAIETFDIFAGPLKLASLCEEGEGACQAASEHYHNK